MKIITTIMFIAWTLTTFLSGYIYYDLTNDVLGGVRGGARSGFHLFDGESIAISSSSPMHDFVIARNTGTSTIMLTSDHASSSACIIFEDTDSAGFSYCNYLNGTQTCSSTNICN